MNWTLVSWPLFLFGLAWPTWFALRRAWRWFRRRTHCESCGYSLQARVSDRCPECGHDVVRPSQLVEIRRLALHAVIVLELFIASHLFYRIPAIQMRGWIAAVPTTALIMRLSPGKSEPSAYYWSRLTRELAYRTDVLGLSVEPFLRVDTDAAAQWQERWLINKAMRFNYDPALVSPDWPILAVSILSYACENNLLTPAQRTKVERKCAASVFTRPVWPLGATVTADIEPRFILFGDGIRLTAHSLTPGYSDVVLGMRGIDSIIDDWMQRERVLGVARQSGSVEYELVMERYHVDSNSWEELSRERRVVTIISGSSEHGLQGRKLPLEAIESLNPQLVEYPYFQQGTMARFDVGQSGAFYEGLGETRFAITLTLYRDGKPFSTGSGWWSSPSQMHRRSFEPARVRWNNLLGDATEQFMVPMEAPYGSIWSQSDPPANHDWSILIEGDPGVALRDFDAKSYWAGKYEYKNIPVERVEK